MYILYYIISWDAAQFQKKAKIGVWQEKVKKGLWAILTIGTSVNV